MSASVQIPRRSPRSLYRSNYSSTSSPPSSLGSSSIYPHQTLDFPPPDPDSYPRSVPPSPVATSFAPEGAYTKNMPESRSDGEALVDERKELEIGMSMERRPSLMGSSLRTSTHTVINIGSPSGTPRLISCVRSSQGFDWNQDIFLPSYAYAGLGSSRRERGGAESMGRAPENVTEIRLDDCDDAGGLLPE